MTAARNRVGIELIKLRSCGVLDVKAPQDGDPFLEW